MSEQTFWDAVDGLRESDGGYAREAYGFVVGALGATVQQLPAERLEDPERRHLSGRELLAGVVKRARSEFGPLAPTGTWPSATRRPSGSACRTWCETRTG